MERVQFTPARLILFLVIIAGFVLYKVGGTETGDLSSTQKILTVLGIILILGAIITYVWNGSATTVRGTETAVPVNDPPIARYLFGDARSAPIWLAIRLYVGYEWINAGWHKVTEEAWRNGTALQGFWQRIVQVPDQGNPIITYGWYRSFINFMLDHEWYKWFGPLVAFGEVLVGIGLILGAFTGIAAFFGALMNFNFMLAGSASTNPVLFFLAILLILAWKVAGYLGLDFYLLPRLGTFWRPGTLFQGEAPPPTTDTRPTPRGV